MAVALQGLIVVYFGVAFAPAIQRQIELDSLKGSELAIPPTSASRMSVAAMIWAASTPVVGAAVVFTSYHLQKGHQWWSDATMTLGFTVMLISPVLFLTRQIERRNDRQIRDVRQELTRNVEELRSIVQAQEAVTVGLQHRGRAAKDNFEAIRHDTSFTAFDRFMATAEKEALLSPIGVRAEVEGADFFVRLRREDNGHLLLLLDGVDTPARFSQEWTERLTLDEVLLKLADQVRPTTWWPGDQGWDFARAIESFSDLFVLALDQRRRGLQPPSPVQRVGDWVLSDWDARSVSHPLCQVTFNRLDEDWYRHLSEKQWTDEYEVRQMLVNAAFLHMLSDKA